MRCTTAGGGGRVVRLFARLQQASMPAVGDATVLCSCMQSINQSLRNGDRAQARERTNASSPLPSIPAKHSLIEKTRGGLPDGEVGESSFAGSLLRCLGGF